MVGRSEKLGGSFSLGAIEMTGASSSACGTGRAPLTAGGNDAVGRDEGLGARDPRPGGWLRAPRARSSSEAGTTGVGLDRNEGGSLGGKAESETGCAVARCRGDWVTCRSELPKTGDAFLSVGNRGERYEPDAGQGTERALPPGSLGSA
jgi:hypothetical protein